MHLEESWQLAPSDIGMVLEEAPVVAYVTAPVPSEIGMVLEESQVVADTTAPVPMDCGLDMSAMGCEGPVTTPQPTQMDLEQLPVSQCAKHFRSELAQLLMITTSVFLELVADTVHLASAVCAAGCHSLAIDLINGYDLLGPSVAGRNQ